ncbi:MAG: protein norD, partial [Pannonibacter indicus]
MSGHRLSLLRRVGLGQEKLERAVLDTAALRLPPVIDCFPQKEDNAALYEWLAAWFAHAEPVPPHEDPFVSDLLSLRAAVAATREALNT